MEKNDKVSDEDENCCGAKFENETGECCGILDQKQDKDVTETTIQTRG